MAGRRPVSLRWPWLFVGKVDVVELGALSESSDLYVLDRRAEVCVDVIFLL